MTADEAWKIADENNVSKHLKAIFVGVRERATAGDYTACFDKLYYPETVDVALRQLGYSVSRDDTFHYYWVRWGT